MTNEEKIAKQVTYLREKYNIGKYPDTVEKLCKECDVLNRKFEYENEEFVHEQISITNLGIPKPVHVASLLGYNTNNGPKWFIVDPTYGQFFENEKFKNYMFTNYEEFSNKLLDQGYIECTLLNMKAYVDGFISSNAYVSDINQEEVYKNVEEKVFSLNNIVNKEVRDTKRKIIELLNLKKELLEKSSNDSIKENKEQDSNRHESVHR